MSLRTSIVFRALVTTLAVASAVSPGRGETIDPRPLAAATWTAVRTEHFTIVTDAEPSAAGSIGRRLEEFAYFLSALHPGLRAYPALPTDIYVFRNDVEMKQFTPHGVESISGYSTVGPGRSLFVTSAEIDNAERAQVVCHEYTHLFINANFADTPIWLNEGLAQYYQTFRQRGRHAEFGHELEGRPEWLDKHAPASLDVLFAMNTSARAYQADNELRTTTYVEGWAIVHYLKADPARATRFDSVLVHMRRGAPARAAFREQFPTDQWEALIRDVLQYVHTGMLRNSSVVLEPVEVQDTRDRTLSDGDALAALGDLSLALDADDDAAALFKAALEHDPGHARAQAALGYLADREGDSTRAEAAYAKATPAAGKDSRVALLVALGTLQRAHHVYEETKQPSAAYSAYVLAARGRFRRCLELDPHQPEALGGLGITFLELGEAPDEAVDALESATDALPSYDGYRHALNSARELRSAGH